MWNWLNRANPEPSFEEFRRQFDRMLVQGRHAFDLAANALLGGSDPDVVREDLFRTDKEINHLERLIRREIVVHATVHGTSQLPSCLVMMSIVKDAERIGDYAKNMFDIAAQAPKSRDGVHADLITLKDAPSSLLAEARDLYDSQDEEQAREFCARADELADHCDAEVARMLGPAPGTDQPALSALAYRYHKRVIAHLSNIVTSIFMPVDRLDYYDEAKETRDP